MRPERFFGAPATPAASPGLAAAILAFSLLLSHSIAALEGFAYTRAVEVPAAGWVRVPLDLGALRHMAPGGADLRVFAPNGEPVPSRLSASLPQRERRPLRLEPSAEVDGEGAQVFDAGEDALPHELLVFDLALTGPLPPFILETSPDGPEDAAWQTLVSGVPRRLGGEEGLQRVAFSYPSTSDRFLRLRWPKGSAVAVAAAEVETVTGHLTLSTRGARCGQLSSAAVCLLELPAGQILRRLIVEIEAEGAVGYRLYAPWEARWQLLVEGVWAPMEHGRRHVDISAPSLAGSLLRLELQGEKDRVPRLNGYGLELAVQSVLFRASVAGDYILAYGGLAGALPPPAWRPDAGPALWIEPGAEQEDQPPPIPGTAGEPLERSRFSAAWIVAPPSAEPGDLVRLEVPAAVYGAARADLGDLRLAANGRQIPFYRWLPPDPAFAAGEPALRPAESDRPGESQVVLALPAGSLPLTQLHLTAPPAPLRLRPVSAVFVDPDRRSRRGGGPAREPAAGTIWTCMPAPPLPCREALQLAGNAPRLLVVRLRDGDEPRLPVLGVTAWRRRDVLLFVWPDLDGDGAVRLLAGDKDLEAPRYDFAEIGPLLLSRPWQAAELRNEGAAPTPPWWSRWVMPAALILAGAWLVLLLKRILVEA